jgi:hypothetical protein
MRKTVILPAFLALLVPGIAFAAEPAQPPKKCCCEEMKDKDCCADKGKSEHDEHSDHKMDAPKS